MPGIERIGKIDEGVLLNTPFYALAYLTRHHNMPGQILLARPMRFACGAPSTATVVGGDEGDGSGPGEERQWTPDNFLEEMLMGDATRMARER